MVIISPSSRLAGCCLLLNVVRFSSSVSHGDRQTSPGQAPLVRLSHRTPIQEVLQTNSPKSRSVDASGRSSNVVKTKAGALLKGRESIVAAPDPNADVNEALKKAKKDNEEANAHNDAEKNAKSAAADADGLNKKGHEPTPDEKKLEHEKKVAANPWFYACPEILRIGIAFAACCILVAVVLWMVKQQPGAAFQAVMADPEVQAIEAERAKLVAQVAELDAHVKRHAKDLEDQRARESDQTEEERFQEMKLRAEMKANEGEEMLKEYVYDIYNQFAPFLAKKSKLERVMKGGLLNAREKAQKFAFEKIADVGSEVVRTLECEEMLSEIKAMSQMQDTAESVTADTPLALLIAGLVAPMMLQAMAASNKAMALMYFPLLLIFTASFAIDFGAACDTMVWVWFFGMLVLLAGSVSIRLWVAAVAQKTAQQMKASNASLKAAPEAGNSSADAPNPIFVLREKLIAHSRDYFRALFSYDTIVNTKAYQFLNFSTLVMFLWGVLGLWISCRDIVDDEVSCKAVLVISILHVYSFFYLIFASWSCVMLAIWAVTIIAANEDFALKMLHRAEKFDNQYMPGGFPFTALLIRAFILRDSSDMTRLEVRSLEKEVKELTDKKTKLEAKQKEVDSSLLEKQARDAEVNPPRIEGGQEAFARMASQRFQGGQEAFGRMFSQAAGSASSAQAGVFDRVASMNPASMNLPSSAGVFDRVASMNPASMNLPSTPVSLPMNLEGLRSAASEAASDVAQAAQDASTSAAQAAHDASTSVVASSEAGVSPDASASS